MLMFFLVLSFSSSHLVLRWFYRDSLCASFVSWASNMGILPFEYFMGTSKYHNNFVGMSNSQTEKKKKDLCNPSTPLQFKLTTSSYASHMPCQVGHPSQEHESHSLFNFFHTLHLQLVTFPFILCGSVWNDSYNLCSSNHIVAHGDFIHVCYSTHFSLSRLLVLRKQRPYHIHSGSSL